MKISRISQLVWLFILCVPFAKAQPQPGSLLWSFDVGTWITGDPALGQDGTIYLTGQFGALYAITNNGTIASNKWIVPGRFGGPPAVAADGTIYAADGSLLRAIAPGGAQIWSAECGGSPAVALDGTIYTAGSGLLCAITPGGDVKWTNVVAPSSAPFPAVGPDGTVYVSGNGALYAVGPNGEQRWSTPTESANAFPTIGRDGVIYAMTPYLSALSPTGAYTWNTSTFGFAPASVGLDGTLYFASLYGVTLNAVSASGQTLWHAVPVVQTNVPTTTPAIDSVGTIYHASSNAVFAVSPQGTVLWTFQTSYPLSARVPQTSPTIGPDGTIYATVGSTLYALYNTNKLANSSWPMVRQNPRHTGSVERPVLKQPQKRSDGGFQFQLYAQPGQALDIQTTTDLITWNSLTNLVVTNLPTDVVDLTASNADLRYYRAASPP